MSKQDRQGVRTPADIERKYDLGKLNSFRGDSQKQDLAVSELTQKVDHFIANTNGNFENINADIDGIIEDIDNINSSVSGFNGTVAELNNKYTELNNKVDELEDEADNPQSGTAISPTIDVTDIEGGHRVTVTDVNGVKTFDVMDGKDGTSAEGVEWENVNNKPSTYPPSSHNHTWDSVQSKPSTFPPSSHSHSWDSVTDKPSTFSPSSHSHSWDSVTGKPSNLVKVLSKTYTASTNSNGNANTSIATSGYIILSISAKDSSGSENYLCNLYRSTSGGGRWYANVTNITSKANVANTSFTFTIYYAAV